jgi:hypothetical protein
LGRGGSSSIVTSSQFSVTNIFCLALGKKQESAEQGIGQTCKEKNIYSIDGYPFALCHFRPPAKACCGMANAAAVIATAATIVAIAKVVFL